MGFVCFFRLWAPYGQHRQKEQVLRSFYAVRSIAPRAGELFTPASGRVCMVAGVSIAMFVALVGFGGKYFGWSDPDGKVQLALITSFILGIIGGFKSRD